jgi:hypothetical protein
MEVYVLLDFINLVLVILGLSILFMKQSDQKNNIKKNYGIELQLYHLLVPFLFLLCLYSLFPTNLVLEQGFFFMTSFSSISTFSYTAM